MSLSTNVSAYTGVEFTLLCKEGFSASPDHGTMLCDDNGQWQNKALCRSGFHIFFTFSENISVLPIETSQHGITYQHSHLNLVNRSELESTINCNQKKARSLQVG